MNDTEDELDQKRRALLKSFVDGEISEDELRQQGPSLGFLSIGVTYESPAEE